MRTSLLLLFLVVFLIIGNIRADDDGDEVEEENKCEEESTTCKEKTPSNTEKKPFIIPAAIPSRDGKCGLQINRPNGQIVGGQNASEFKWPWMVALLNRRTSEPECGGVLLTERHVLTAVHCFINLHYQNVQVRLGEYNLDPQRVTKYEENFTISDLQIHPEFEFYDYTRKAYRTYDVNSRGYINSDYITHYRNDIALLTLDKPAKFNEAIYPVCLPPKEAQDFNGMNAVALGWGKKDRYTMWSHVLQEVELPIVDQKKCNKRHSGIEIFPKKEICAAPSGGGRDTCNRDSGGPLLVQLHGRWTVIGIVSWGPTQCGASGLPAVYTRVDGFL